MKKSLSASFSRSPAFVGISRLHSRCVIIQFVKLPVLSFMSAVHNSFGYKPTFIRHDSGKRSDAHCIDANPSIFSQTFCILLVCSPGGTNADMAPQIDYFTMVMAPIVEKLGVKFDLDVVRRGYYPKGMEYTRAPQGSGLRPLDIKEPDSKF